MTRWPESGGRRGRGAEAPQETRRGPERARRPQELRGLLPQRQEQPELLERARRLVLTELAQPELQEQRTAQQLVQVPELAEQQEQQEQQVLGLGQQTV